MQVIFNSRDAPRHASPQASSHGAKWCAGHSKFWPADPEAWTIGDPVVHGLPPALWRNRDREGFRLGTIDPTPLHARNRPTPARSCGGRNLSRTGRTIGKAPSNGRRTSFRAECLPGPRTAGTYCACAPCSSERRPPNRPAVASVQGTARRTGTPWFRSLPLRSGFPPGGAHGVCAAGLGSIRGHYPEIPCTTHRHPEERLETASLFGGARTPNSLVAQKGRGKKQPRGLPLLVAPVPTDDLPIPSESSNR